MQLILLTISPEASVFERFFKRLKVFIKNRFFYYGGPQAVLNSLLRGFDSLKIDYLLNPSADKIYKMAEKGEVYCGVLSDIKALRWAIEVKKFTRLNFSNKSFGGQVRIKKIIAGPNLALMPVDAGNILLDENIDLVLVPSQWVKDFWLSVAPQLEDKIRIWPAGVEVPGVGVRERSDLINGVIASPKGAAIPKIASSSVNLRTPRNDNSWIGREETIPNCLIYKKNADEHLCAKILKFLELKGIFYQIIEYGRYKKKDYWKMLDKAKFMIYLQESESQGLALAEAWMRNVPTLVWSRGYCEVRGQRWNDPKSAAPYLTDECGMFFKDEDDFKHKLPVFLEKIHQFMPRKYAIENFSDETAAKRYLEIIKTHGY